MPARPTRPLVDVAGANLVVLLSRTLQAVHPSRSHRHSGDRPLSRALRTNVYELIKRREIETVHVDVAELRGLHRNSMGK
jgi:hypothetical protein